MGRACLIRVRTLLFTFLLGCAGNSFDPTDPGKNDSVDDSGGVLAPGTLDVAWMHGSASCGQNTEPELQVHAYNATTHILRQNKCDTFEAPFIYVLAGTERALIFDTGATATATLRDTTRKLIGSRELVVTHSHAHGDHIASDARFEGQPLTTVIGISRGAVQAAFGITSWPTGEGTIDLGDRVLDVLAIPGHEATSIALYDRQTGLLLTGDTLYPGLLFINSWNEYRASISRLARFVATHEVSHVLGAHVEMTATPKLNYEYGTTFQPDEHVLQLAPRHLAELDAKLTELGSSTPSGSVPLDDFVIDPQ
ncbi:MAG: gloB2 [Deltaproteobacteria bacterium]|nr:gloB2 [Deltaproteobacteria bacterium]